MTAEKQDKSQRTLLEQILGHVEAIDKNVDELLDHVSDHIDDARSRTWYDPEYGAHNLYD